MILPLFRLAHKFQTCHSLLCTCEVTWLELIWLIAFVVFNQFPSLVDTMKFVMRLFFCLPLQTAGLYSSEPVQGIGHHWTRKYIIIYYSPHGTKN